jgi:hypothetical protein
MSTSREIKLFALPQSFLTCAERREVKSPPGQNALGIK